MSKTTPTIQDELRRIASFQNAQDHRTCNRAADLIDDIAEALRGSDEALLKSGKIEKGSNIHRKIRAALTNTEGA